jgi:hypothetical protein
VDGGPQAEGRDGEGDGQHGGQERAGHAGYYASNCSLPATRFPRQVP